MTAFRRALIALVYVGSILAANVLTDHLGLVPIGFGLLVTAGTFTAGATLLARNVGQDVIGRAPIIGLMVIGALLSWWLASPALAAASVIAFSLSESADMFVFSRLRKQGWSRAVMAAAALSGLIDTWAFLYVAGFPVTVDSVTGQWIVKFGISAVVGLSVYLYSHSARLPFRRLGCIRYGHKYGFAYGVSTHPNAPRQSRVRCTWCRKVTRCEVLRQPLH